MTAIRGRPSSVRVGALVALVAGAGPIRPGWADEDQLQEAAGAPPPAYFIELGGGYTLRGDHQTGPAGVVETRGGAMSHARLASSLYPGGGALGLSLRASADRFHLNDRTSGAMPEAIEASLLEVSAGLALRSTSRGAFNAEALLGYSLHIWPLFDLLPDGRVEVQNVRDHGPLLGARASFEPLSWLALYLRGVGVPMVLGAASGGARLSGRHLDLGGGLQLGNLPLGGLRLAAVLDYGYGLTTLQGGSVDLKVNRHLIAGGLRASQGSPGGPSGPAAMGERGDPTTAGQALARAHPPPPAAPPTPTPEAWPAPAPSAPSLDPDPPPPLPDPAARAPATLRGTVWARTTALLPGRARRVPLDEAALTWTGADGSRSAVRSNARGQFLLDALPPGEGTLHIEAPGYKAIDKPLALAVGEREEIDLTLETTGSGKKAILRGSVRSAHGSKLRAILAIPEANLREELKRNGAFAFEVAPGTYTLKVSARGYVTQSKSVELSGGEESIFSIELRKRRR